MLKSIQSNKTTENYYKLYVFFIFPVFFQVHPLSVRSQLTFLMPTIIGNPTQISEALKNEPYDFDMPPSSVSTAAATKTTEKYSLIINLNPYHTLVPPARFCADRRQVFRFDRIIPPERYRGSSSSTQNGTGFGQ